VTDAAATRGQYLALSKAWWSYYYFTLFHSTFCRGVVADTWI